MERIYVAVRARPLPPEESENSPWRISGNSIFLYNQPSKFEFDRVFGDDCKTVDIFEARTKEIVASVVRGFNGTVFAYGQTSSGKTYTMRGSANEPGIIPLSVHELFCSIQEEMDREFLLRISYMEIYNEEINDLLSPEHRKLQIHESIERGIYVAGLKEEIVNSPEQVLKLVEFGESRRHIGVTNMNLYSSRSHTIFRMIVESRDRSVGDDSFTCFDAVRVSALNLVDLAGSERAGKTGAEGMRLKEGSHINKSLMTLGNVIKKLSDGVESLGGHVPYRDSKLTRILQPALGGNANTAMICNITLSQIHADETKSTLLFASRALQVKNCACVNEILTDAALLKRQKKEIEELRTKLLSSHSEYLEEEILNLRNTLLQSELEKERIVLELEEEKKAKAHRDRRLLEQARKIENLSSLILCSERDDKTIRSIQRKRRLTWCPGPFQKKSSELQSNPEADIMEPVEDKTGKSLLHPFSQLVQESEDHVDIIPLTNCSLDDADHTDNLESFSLPDAHALLNVTSRRKNHLSRVGLPFQGDHSAEKVSEFADLIFESDAKLLEDRSNSPKVARLTNEQLLLLFSNQNFTKGFNDGDTALKLSASIEDIALHFDLLKNACDAAFAITEECFQFFVILSEILEGFKMLPRWCIVQLKSIVSGHKSINSDMNMKLKEVELYKDQCLHHDMEKDELLSQVLYLQKEVSQLSLSSLVWEKDALRKELDKTKSKLKDTDCKLKNVIQEKVKLEGEKAQAERVIKSLQGQQSILERNILKHDSHLNKRRELRSDFNKVKGLKPVAQQNLQDDYDKLEFLSFEMEAEISSLKEALEITIGEKECAYVKNDNLNSELEAMTNKLKTAFSEMELLKEELERMEQRLADSESSSRELEDSLDLLSKEKEEMISQLTEALLEVEAEKLCWNSKEKTLIEKLERLNNEIVELSKNLSEVIEELDLCKNQCKSFRERLCLSDGIIKSEKDSSLSKSSEIGLLRDEFDRLGVKADGNKDEKTNLELVSWQLHPSCSQMHNTRSSLLRVTGERENLLSKVDELRSLEFEMETLEGKYNDLQSNAELFFQELNQRISSFEVEMQEFAQHRNKESSELRKQLSSTQTKLDTYRRRLKEALDERKFMDSKYQEASTKLKDQLRSYGHHILDLTKQLAEKR